MHLKCAITVKLKLDTLLKHVSDDWTISGVVVEDYYYWVNEFKANHPIFGKVWGDFEFEVFADSEEGYTHFVKHHEYQAWDYGDI